MKVMAQSNWQINGHGNTEKDIKTRNFVDENGLRADGRKPENLRKKVLKVGVTSEATGSAYLESGNTKVICSVYGPRDVLKRSEFSDKGQLYCEFKYAPYSCKTFTQIMSSEEKAISSYLMQALESVILTQKFPKARLDIFIMVLENDGSAVAHALTCAGAAVSNAGVEIYDLIIGCSLRQCETYTFIDPTYEEEELSDKAIVNHGRVTIGMMPSLNQVVMLMQDGEFKVLELSKCIKELAANCQMVLTLVGNCLRQAIENKNKGLGVERIRNNTMED